MKPTIVEKLSLRSVTEWLEGSASIQLVCPYCHEVQTETVIGVLGGQQVYTCGPTYHGAGCGRRFIGPA